MSYDLKLCIIVVSSFILVVLSSVYVLSAYASPALFPIDSKPYGLTYSQWVAKWWQWALSLPANTNPMNDKTGVNCAQAQQGPVWFLAGTSGGGADRVCRVPFGKALFLNILSSECSRAEYPGESQAQLLNCAVNLDNGGKVKAKIDGMYIENLTSYRIQSPVFNVTFPKDDVFGVSANNANKPVQTISVADGWYVMLRPLPPGKHTIYFFGSNNPAPSTGSQSYSTEVTYTITVQKE